MDELRDTQYNLPIGMDTISRCEAIDALRKMQTYKLFSGDDMLLIDQAEAMTELMLLPSAEPKRGKWIDGIIPNDSGGLPVIVCDQCNTFFPLQFGDGHNFCPNCGAKMEVTG